MTDLPNGTACKGWRRLARPELGVLNSISEVVAQEEWLKAAPLNSVRRGPTLFLGSDYGGEHKGAHFETLSFILIDLQYIWLWDELRTKLRKTLLPQRRRMAFKSLNDQARRRALVPFLRYANTLPGLLFTFALDQGAIDLLSWRPSSNSDLPFGPLSNWRLSSLQKLSRVAQLGATLVAGMSAPGQNLIWISDDDNIVPNRQKLIEATRVVGRYIDAILPHMMGHLRFGSAGTVDRGDQQTEDLVALADLAAGAVSEILTEHRKDLRTAASAGLLLRGGLLSDKTRLILAWLAENDHPLRKTLILIEGTHRATEVKAVSLFRDGEKASESMFNWRNDVDEHLKKRILAVTDAGLVFLNG
jgi:hypothetical protein